MRNEGRWADDEGAYSRGTFDSDARHGYTLIVEVSGTSGVTTALRKESGKHRAPEMLVLLVRVERDCLPAPQTRESSAETRCGWPSRPGSLDQDAARLNRE